MSHGDFVSVGGIGGHCRAGLPGDRGCETGHLGKWGSADGETLY